MQPNAVDVGRGIAWITEGWQVFAKNPGTWVLMTVVLFVLFLVLAFIPFGGFALTLFAPALAAGLLYGAAELRADRPLQIAHLFHGFRDQTRLGKLVVLGLVAVAAGFASALIFAGSAGHDVAAAMNAPDQADAPVPLGPRVLVALLLAFTVQLLATALLYFAVPLVMFLGAPAGAAMQSSLRACLRNVLPLFVFSVVYVLLAVVASIPLGLGWLVLVPWSVGMLYCSYRDIFESAAVPA